MPKKKNKHYKPQVHTNSKGIINTWQNGYNQGLCDGQLIMADIIFVALHDEFGFGNSNPEKWEKLETQANYYLENIVNNIRNGDAEMGFEKIVEGIKRARPDKAPEIEERYRKVLYNFKK
jgi:hypothetical protein